MSSVTFLGDEASAAGFRLAGARTVVPPRGREIDAFRDALAHAELVVVTSGFAAALPSETLRAAQAATSPLVAIVPDLDGAVAIPDIALRLRTQLGLEA